MNFANCAMMRLIGARCPIGLVSLAILVVGCCFIARASAQAPDEVKSDKVKVEPIMKGLDHPCGIAIRPGSTDLYIAESGAGRIIRVRPAEPDRSINVVTGFAQEPFGAEPSYRLGPLGL